MVKTIPDKLKILAMEISELLLKNMTFIKKLKYIIFKNMLLETIFYFNLK